MDTNTRNELQALDEALEYLNEGKVLNKISGSLKKLYSKWVEFADKYNEKYYKTHGGKPKASSSQSTKENDPKDYSSSQYQYCHRTFKDVVEAYKNGELIRFLNDKGSVYFEELSYLNIPQSKFESEVKKFVSKNPNALQTQFVKLSEDELYDIIHEDDEKEAKKIVDFLKNNDHIVVGDNGFGDSVLYFIKSKIFLTYFHEDSPSINLSEKITYNDIVTKLRKNMYTVSSDSSSYRTQFTNAAIAADSNLGYYLISEPPEGEKAIKL